MTKLIFIFSLITTTCFSQLELRVNPYLEGEIAFKSGKVKKGYIKLDDSAFRVRFKENKNNKKYKKVKTDSISKIVIHSNSSTDREFCYKKTDQDKFNKFVELIYSNKLDVYIYSSDNLSLFYSDIDRSNVTDWIGYARSEISAFNAKIEQHLKDQKDGTNEANSIDQFYQSQKTTYSKIKENLSKVKNVKYLLQKKDSEKLIFIYSNKKLRNFSILNFNDCPELIRKIENKILQKNDIIEIIDFYSNCINLTD